MKRRQGFTLVELLVAMALIMFMMAILSQAFVSATGVFRNLKAAGDMAEKLRATTQLLQRDLAADHFEGKKRLSDPDFWENGPPQQGFFNIWQDISTFTTSEGVDTAGVGSYRDVYNTLGFTVKLRGNQMGDFMSASGGMAALSSGFGPAESRYQSPTAPLSYNYQWATVDWFALPSTNPATGQPDTTAPDQATGAAPVPLYTLYRRQRLLVPDNSLVPAPQTNTALFYEVSYWVNGGNLYFNSPMDITVPQRRVLGITGYSPLPAASGALYGSDIQLTNVVSFDVRILPVYPPGTTPANPVDPFTTLLQSPFTTPTNYYAYTQPTWYVQGMAFDTWSSVNDGLSNFSTWNTPGTASVSIPFWNAATQSGPIIKAIQISIRIWDEKTNQTRQVTIIQAM